MYAVIESGAVARYPADPLADNPTTSFAQGWLGDVIGGAEYVAVAPSPQPAHDATTQTVTEAAPALIGRIWTQQWTVRDLTVEELAANLAARRAQMVVSPFQARAALAQAGLLAQAEAAVAQASATAQLAWQYAQEFRRDSPTLLALAAALNLDDAALDALFATAAGITA